MLPVLRGKQGDIQQIILGSFAAPSIKRLLKISPSERSN